MLKFIDNAFLFTDRGLVALELVQFSGHACDFLVVTVHLGAVFVDFLLVFIGLSHIPLRALNKLLILLVPQPLIPIQMRNLDNLQLQLLIIHSLHLPRDQILHINCIVLMQPLP